MTIEELVGRLKRIHTSLDCSSSSPPMMNEHSLMQVRLNIKELITDVEKEEEIYNG